MHTLVYQRREDLLYRLNQCFKRFDFLIIHIMALSILLVNLGLIGVAVIGVQSNHVKVDDLQVEMTTNLYFGKIETEIKPDGDDSSISVNLPIKQNLDEKFQVNANINFSDISILKDEVILLCDAITEDGFFRPIVKKITPNGKFPIVCPIPMGEWKIRDYVIDMSDYLPFGIVPSGHFDALFDIGLPNAEPLIKILVNGTVSSFGDSLSRLKSIFASF